MIRYRSYPIRSRAAPVSSDRGVLLPPSRAAWTIVAGSALLCQVERVDEPRRNGASRPGRARPRAPPEGGRARRHGSPSSFTPPWRDHPPRVARRERRTPSASSAGRWSGSPAGSGASATSSGAPPSRTTRVKCASAARAASAPCERATMKRASASFASIGSPGGTAPAPRRAGTSRRASRRGSASSGRTAPRAPP